MGMNPNKMHSIPFKKFISKKKENTNDKDKDKDKTNNDNDKDKEKQQTEQKNEENNGVPHGENTEKIEENQNKIETN